MIGKLLSPEHSPLKVTIVEARNLPAADANGKSDPYVQLLRTHGLDHAAVKTKVVKKNLNPVWNETFEFSTSYKLHNLKFKVFDHDTFSADELLGNLKVPMDLLRDGKLHDEWFPLLSKNLTPAGELHLKIQYNSSIPVVQPGEYVPINSNSITVGLGWDISKKRTLDLDSSIVGVDAANATVDTVSFRHLIGFEGGVKHGGDNRTGEGAGDDEEIFLTLDKIPQSVQVLMVCVDSYAGVPFTQIKSTYIRLIDTSSMKSPKTIAFYRVSKMTETTGLFFGFLFRTGAQWNFKTVALPVTGTTCEQSLPQMIDHLKKLQNPRPEAD